MTEFLQKIREEDMKGIDPVRRYRIWDGNGVYGGTTYKISPPYKNKETGIKEVTIIIEPSRQLKLIYSISKRFLEINFNFVKVTYPESYIIYTRIPKSTIPQVLILSAFNHQESAIQKLNKQIYEENLRLQEKNFTLEMKSLIQQRKLKGLHTNTKETLEDAEELREVIKHPQTEIIPLMDNGGDFGE